MDNLREQLQAAVGGTYRIERELGGGMSRVFVAAEVALGRRVVIKVLPPDLAAGVNVERFRREIQLAASLQHPHIVQLLTAGAADHLLYYVMPLIPGESLRTKLAREGELPVRDAVRILRDVVDALAYAHAQGVVHRDIKPDNVLLSGNHALVTDFGVAKAVSAAGGGPMLTSAGLALGTPAYMAPEQAAGEPSVDARADLYAVGVVAYEMLSGRLPFKVSGVAAMLAAQVTRTPEPLTGNHQAIPPLLTALVMRCLEKEPADRWQRAEDLLAELEAIATPTLDAATAGAVRPGSAAAGRSPARRKALFRGSMVVGGVALIAAAYGVIRLGGIGSVQTLLAKGALRVREPIILSDFENRSADSSLGRTLTEAFRVDLSQSSTVTLVDAARITDGLRRMQRDPGAPLTPALARELAQREGIKAVVTGVIDPVGQGYVLAASVVSAANGGVLTGVRESAADQSALIPALDRLSRSLRERIGESVTTIRANDPLEQVTTRSLEALQKYTEALRTDAAGDPEAAIPLLQQATALDTGFAMAYRKLAVLLDNVGGSSEQVVASATHAFVHRDRLPPRERDQTTAWYYFRVDYDPDRSMAAYRDALTLDSNDVIALNNLSLLLMRQRQMSAAESLLLRGVATRRCGTVCYLNAISAQASQGHYADAQAMLDSFARTAPRDPAVLALRGVLASAQRDYAAAERLTQQLLQAQSTSLFWREEATGTLAALSTIEGHLARAERYGREAMATAERRGLSEHYLKEALGLAVLDLLIRNRPAGALQTIARALERHPLETIPPLDRPYTDLARLYAHAGRAAEARRLLAEYERVVPASLRKGNFDRHAADGDVAAAEGRFDDAVAAYQAWQEETGCDQCGLFEQAQVYVRAGQPDSAVGRYERMLAANSLHRFGNDALFLAPTYKRLGELYEARHDRAKAIDSYQHFVDLWRTADPELQQSVQDVRGRIGRLTTES